MFPCGEHFGGCSQSPGPQIFHRARAQQTADFPGEGTSAHVQGFLQIQDTERRVAHVLLDFTVQSPYKIGIPLHQIDGLAVGRCIGILHGLLDFTLVLDDALDAGSEIVQRERLLDIQCRPVFHATDFGLF